MREFLLFYGIVFIAFGLGISLSQLIGNKLVSGLIFLCIGFLFLLLNIIVEDISSYHKRRSSK